MELLATLFTDLPLDERRFHGLLHDLASSDAVGTISPRGLLAEHDFGEEGQRPNCSESIQVIVQQKGCVAASVLEQLQRAGFRPAHALEFRAQDDSNAQISLWPLLRAYVGELQGWVLTTTLDFEETKAHLGTQADLFPIAATGDGACKAVLISATTMKQLAP